MLSKIVFISDRLKEFQKYFRSDNSFDFGVDLLTHAEASRRYIYRNYYELFVVDLQTPWLYIPQWIREQAQHFYFHQFIFISDKKLTPQISEMLGRRIFKVVAFGEALQDLQPTLDEVKHFFEEHQYQYDTKQFISDQSFEGLLGEDPAVKRINEFINLVSKARYTPCLISGEDGSGKWLCANLIHHANDLHADLFAVKDCEKATTNDLLGDLFGVADESGVYGPKRKGLLELYKEGTVVLKNIEKCPPDVQDKILLYLTDKIIRPLGAKHIIEASTRIIAITTHNLEWFVKHRHFNSDLFFHLNAFEIFLPPLRKRGNDLLAIANYYLHFSAQHLAKDIVSISLPAQKLLKSYHWPGNIGELKSVIEDAVLKGTTQELGPRDLPAYLSNKPSGTDEFLIGNCSVKDMEKIHIERVLRNTDGNKSKTSAILNISRTTLREKIKQYKIND